MIAFPKLLYLIQTLPFVLKQNNLKEITALFRTFIWNGKRPRISMLKMQQQAMHGGLHLPDIKQYNIAALTRILIDWLHSTSIYRMWDIDSCFTHPLNLINTLHLHKQEISQELSSNPLIMSTWQVWHTLRSKYNLNSHHSLRNTFLSNEEFQHGQASYPFVRWKVEGLSAIKHTVNKNLKRQMTFQELREKFAIVHSHNIAFMQIQSYTKKVCTHLSDSDWDNSLDRVLEKGVTSKGAISQYYKRN
ncbi:hypothetical protein XELAEV_18020616mg [Xenopus laevis]|uniref:Uncharacterized protein n=1 Tax=Xenopus laevis TaxID=8355 RepID=A0A974HR67_XENLA|nr:hypothetical protein XELAEV_18020616mg [Xenopus laevis]